MSRCGYLHAAALVAWSLALTATSPVRAEDATALRACRDISDDAQRLACYDALTLAPEAERAVAPSGSPQTESVRTPAAAATTATVAVPASPSPEELFGRDAAQSGEIIRQAAGIPQLDKLRTRITAVAEDPSGKAIVTIANGQVWNQLDRPPARLTPGEEIEIRRAAMGSFLLVRNVGGRGIRVRRLR